MLTLGQRLYDRLCPLDGTPVDIVRQRQETGGRDPIRQILFYCLDA